jgi:hypothetical protein
MKKLRVVLVSAVAAGAVATAAISASSPTIGQTSITGAKIGLTASAYEKLFGAPHSTRRAGGDHEITLLTFPNRKVAVMFVRSSKAISVITWNRAYRTDHGVGPCSTLAQLQKVYGAALVQDKYGAYDLGNLLFDTSTGSSKVVAVGLYNSREPHAKQNFGAQPYTSYAMDNLVPSCS